MGRFRYSLAKLMLLALVVAIGCSLVECAFVLDTSETLLFSLAIFVVLVLLLIVLTCFEFEGIRVFWGSFLGFTLAHRLCCWLFPPTWYRIALARGSLPFDRRYWHSEQVMFTLLIALSGGLLVLLLHVTRDAKRSREQSAG